MLGMTEIQLHNQYERGRGTQTLIDAIGAPEFQSTLFAFLDKHCVAEHCGAYWVGRDALSKCAGLSRDGSDMSSRAIDSYMKTGYWQEDPSLSFAKQRSRGRSEFLFEVDTTCIGSPAFREEMFLSQQMYHRLLICYRRPDGGIATLDLLRSPKYGAFGSNMTERLGQTVLELLPIVFKHFEIEKRLQIASSGTLDSIEKIEHRLAVGSTYFSLRERQVAARILNGLSTLGIALDLNIAKDTVSTYRKRLYGRLGIATHHELLRWYLTN